MALLAMVSRKELYKGVLKVLENHFGDKNVAIFLSSSQAVTLKRAMKPSLGFDAVLAKYP